MKVLFAVSSESISDAIIKRYQKEYKEILSYKNVYYFNAILKEIQKDKSYDRIVISEDLEPFSNNNYDTIDKFIFEKLDNISDEAHDSQGKETSIILICTDRHTKSSSFLVKLFGIGVYNALLGSDRSMEQVCKLINQPRVKKEAKMYYKIDADDVNYDPTNEKEVSELEIQNILNHFKKISKNKEKYADSFNNIAAQYTDDQLKIIINCLPIGVKAVLEEDSPKYQELMSASMIQRVGGKASLQAKEETQKTGIKIDILENKLSQPKMSGPIVIPSSVRTSGKKGPVKVVQVDSAEKKLETSPPKKVVKTISRSQNIQSEETKSEEFDNLLSDIDDEKKVKTSSVESKTNKSNLSNFLDEDDDLLMSLDENEDDLLVSTEIKEDIDPFLEEEQEDNELLVSLEKEQEDDGLISPLLEEEEENDLLVSLEEQDDELLTSLEENVNEEIEDSLLTDFENEESTSNINENSAITIKRGRGRPRKFPISEEVKPKGKRGRPRKDTTFVETKTENEIEDEPLDLMLDIGDETEESMTPDMFLNQEDDDLLVSLGEEQEDDDLLVSLGEEQEDDDLLVSLGEEQEDDDLLVSLEEEQEDDDLLVSLGEEQEDDDLLVSLGEEQEDDDLLVSLGEEQEDDDLLVSLGEEQEDDDLLVSLGEEQEDDDLLVSLGEEQEDDDLLMSLEEQEGNNSISEIDEIDDLEDYEEDTEDDLLPGMEYEEIDENDYFISGNSKQQDDDSLIMTIDEDEEDDDDLLLTFSEDTIDDSNNIPMSSNNISKSLESNETISNQKYNNYQNEATKKIESIKPQVDYSMSTLNSLLTREKKIVTFIGTTKNGTSFLINNLAALFSSLGINTAILDMTQNRNSYYIYTKNEESLRKIAYTSIEKLENGFAEGIKVDKNLTVYTALPNNGKNYANAEAILSTLVQNHSLILIDCDFDTDPSYFASCQEIYLVQSMDILTIQPLTSFLRDLKAKGVLESEKVRVIINKEIKVRSLTTKMIIGGMSFYNDPAMAFMTELFNKDIVKACTIPFEDITYSKYLDAMVNCNVSLNGYSKAFLSKLRILGDMVYPLTSKQSYSKPMQNQNKNAFSNSMNNTLNQMKNKF